MTTTTIKILNSKEIAQQIKRLDDKMRKKIMISAMRKASKSMVKEARNTAPKGKKPHKVGNKIVMPGNLRKSVGSKTGKSKADPTLWIGANMKKNVDAFYHHIVMRGSKAHTITGKALAVSNAVIVKNVNHPGSKKNDFIGRAFYSKKAEFVNNSVRELNIAIAKAVSK